ncbi:hypothetical protein O3P69_009192 [Scylla paramamosain]|uniref:Uncharacterized protein n=1 Tax=Scylla paramamosain TaxID=85552 RepID=A0AAW0TBW0_SCYPA
MKSAWRHVQHCLPVSPVRFLSPDSYCLLLVALLTVLGFLLTTCHVGPPLSYVMSTSTVPSAAAVGLWCAKPSFTPSRSAGVRASNHWRFESPNFWSQVFGQRKSPAFEARR